MLNTVAPMLSTTIFEIFIWLILSLLGLSVITLILVIACLALLISRPARIDQHDKIEPR